MARTSFSLPESTSWGHQMDLEAYSDDPLDLEDSPTLLNHRRDKLCIDLLDVIMKSVRSFRPSKSLACLHSTPNVNDEPAAEIDVVVSGGGLKGYFMTGCSHVLLNELERQNIRIARIAGASAGAWVGLFMLTGFGTENWLETFYLTKERPGLTIHEAYDEMWTWLQSILPENAYQICSGRLFISITEISIWGFKNHIISEFTSNQDLYECCLASSTVPYLSLPHAYRKYRNMWVLDGGITNNTPIFPDNIRRQLVFRLTDVFYPTKFLLSPKDQCIESLVVRGAILMSRFLQGEESDSFSWLEQKPGTPATPTPTISLSTILWQGAKASTLFVASIGLIGLVLGLDVPVWISQPATKIIVGGSDFLYHLLRPVKLH